MNQNWNSQLENSTLSVLDEYMLFMGLANTTVHIHGGIPWLMSTPRLVTSKCSISQLQFGMVGFHENTENLSSLQFTCLTNLHKLMWRLLLDSKPFLTRISCKKWWSWHGLTFYFSYYIQGSSSSWQGPPLLLDVSTQGSGLSKCTGATPRSCHRQNRGLFSSSDDQCWAGGTMKQKELVGWQGI